MTATSIAVVLSFGYYALQTFTQPFEAHRIGSKTCSLFIVHCSLTDNRVSIPRCTYLKWAMHVRSILGSIAPIRFSMPKTKSGQLSAF
ncbi:hypothetical protein ASE07_06595 [Noviherbaspirillum sp. Root189]|nr:hypothetical protein ASE07_06595 [Noviherbaspirillum sp. Root189]